MKVRELTGKKITVGTSLLGGHESNGTQERELTATVIKFVVVAWQMSKSGPLFTVNTLAQGTRRD